MTPTLWKFTQELASLNKINDIDKEKIKCISIHATTNAAVEHFILSDNDQKNEISDNKPNGSETKKHSLGQDEELTSIKRKQMDVESPNVDIKSVTKNRYVLKWNFEEDLRPARVEWIIDEISISESFFSLKEHAISMANEHKLTYSNHPGEMLALNSILLLEENSIHAKLNIPSDIRRKVFKQMKDMYSKHDLPNVVSELCHQCAKIAREETRMNLEDSIEVVYDNLRKILLISICSGLARKFGDMCKYTPCFLFEHIFLKLNTNSTLKYIKFNSVGNLCTTFDDPLTIEDTYLHHLIHPILANKMSLASASRKIDSDGEGHRPDFMLTIDLNGYNKFEILFGLFKSPSKGNSQLVNVDLVDLGVLMKDSLDDIYGKGVELEMVVFGIHSFGYNIRIYAMDLSYDGVYRMFLLGEFELPRSNLSLCLVEVILYEIVNLKKNLLRGFHPMYPTITNNNEKTPSKKIMMMRKTLATPQK
ncbi:15074_t:CDS:2, partial [Entrophospora sp. SA101]